MQNNVHVEVPFGARCARVLELIETEKVSVFPGVPHIFKALAEAPADPKVDTSSLRFCFSGGNFLEVNVFDLFMRRFGVAVRQMYGCTEAGSVSINREVQGARFKKSSVGQPVKGVEVKIVDELKNELLAGKIGEIAIKGLALTAGYSNVVNGDIANFKESWFFTGDLGKKDKEGFIYIIGRKRTFIDTGGYKVDPAEIEDVLAGFPGVAEAVVVGIEVPGGEELIKAVIVPSGDCDAEAVRAYCEEKLADFKIPRMIEFRRELPRNPMGKVLKKDLLNAENIPAQTEEVPADLFRKILLAASRADLQTCLETYLREQCARLLKLHPSTIDARQRLSDLGLTSVTSIELSTRITLDVKQECSPGMIWNYPTIALLAAYLAERIAGIAASKATQATQEPQGQE
jgi:long-chain acyl-CoA synthetase